MRSCVKFFRLVLIVCLALTLFTNCVNNDNVADIQSRDAIDFDNESYVSIAEGEKTDLKIKEHYLCQKEETIKIVRDNESVAIVNLGKPIVIAQAEDECEWGWFQFPVIYFVEDGNIMVQWQMKPDSYTVYGDNGTNARLISKDNGLTWMPEDKNYYHKDNMYVELKDGDILQFSYCESRDTKNYVNIPSPVNKQPIGDRWFYKESDLPDELRGVYFEYWNKQTGKTTSLHSYLEDPALLRYSYSKDDLMPILFNGFMRLLEDGSLVACVYPGYYQNSKGEVLDCCISFYKSTNQGRNWKRIGRIPYQTSAGKAPETYVYKDGEGFSEPAFEILKDGTYICVMRSGHNLPMYKSFSKDGGVHWSTPDAFTSNGVSPNLLLLNNGVLVLSSGRPGVQLRFNLDGDGDKWTEPLEMLPFMDEKGKYGNNIYEWPTCGYTSLVAVNDNSFYFVWSDFTQKDKDGHIRKAIMFRRVQVIKKS